MKSKLELLRGFVDIHDNLELTVMDVGAANHVSVLPSELQAIINFIGIDPDVLSWPSPATRSYKTEKWLEAIVSNRAGEFDFFVTKKREVSSLREPNRDLIQAFYDPTRFDIVNVNRHSVTTVNQLCLDNEFSEIDFLKIDTQGNTLETLEGASDILEQVQILMVELEVLELYQGQALFDQSIAYLRSIGFSVLDMRPIYWKRNGNEFHLQDKGQLVFFNVLLVNDKQLENFSQKRSLIARIFFLLLYGYLDIANELLENSRFKKEDRFIKTKRLLESFINYEKKAPFEGSVPEWKPL